MVGASFQAVSADLANAPPMVRAAALQAASGRVMSSAAPMPARTAPMPAAGLGPSNEPSDKHLVALREGTIVATRYRIQKLIGRGGMGSVYGVSHVNTGEELALKLLHPALAENNETVERFKTEARAPVRIGSEHVVRVVDADVSPELGVPFIVMERLEGHDLRTEVKRRGALPAAEAVLYLRQVSRALDKAHQRGIVHRDLKPANLYVVAREDGTPLVKILDFGIAKLTDDAAQELTVAGQVFGTPWYMSPEQARGELGKVGPATDLWALGLIAYQLLVGKNYWTADGMAALIAQICYEPMTPPTTYAPQLGAQFDLWFAKACHRDATQRFSSAREMIEELAMALGVAPATDTGTYSRPDSSMRLQAQPLSSEPLPSAPSAASSSHPAISQSNTLGQSQPNMGTSVAGMSASHPALNDAAGVHRGNAPARKSAGLAVAVGVVAALIVGVAAGGVYLLRTSKAQQAAMTSPTATAVVLAAAPTNAPSIDPVAAITAEPTAEAVTSAATASAVAADTSAAPTTPTAPSSYGTPTGSAPLTAPPKPLGVGPLPGPLPKKPVAAPALKKPVTF
jgi:serine/threonine protein kinase